MENAEMEKEWFVTHEGKQFGPVSIDDLKFEAERGQLNPRLDMVWKKDMDDWIPAGNLEGLFEKNVEAEAEEKKKEEPKHFGPPPEVSEEEKKKIAGEWPGAGRGAYLFMSFVFPFIFAVGLGAVQYAVRGMLEPTLLQTISAGLLLIPLIISLAVALKRFRNLGMTRWWFLSLFVPILSSWTYYRLIACPAGYAEHKKLDGIGWFLAILYWLLTLAVTALVATAIYISSSDPDKFKELFGKESQQFSEFLEKARERGNQLNAPEEDAEAVPEPTITPY